MLRLRHHTANRWQQAKKQKQPYWYNSILNKMQFMNTLNFIKRSIIVVSIITGLFSCEKYNEEIFIDNYQKIYGEWISNKKCGGYSGDCQDYNGEILKIVEFGEFEITNEQDNYVKGYIKIISQDDNNLKIRLEEKRGKLILFSRDDLLVKFNGNDSIVFNEEGCCDKSSYEFIRKK